jgi:hypothetical protein
MVYRSDLFINRIKTIERIMIHYFSVIKCFSSEESRIKYGKGNVKRQKRKEDIRGQSSLITGIRYCII